jgi:hypothetical protein
MKPLLTSEVGHNASSNLRSIWHDITSQTLHSRLFTLHTGAYGNGVLEQPTTAAALSLTPQLESYVKGSTADVSEAGISYPTSHGSQVQRFLATRAICLNVFAHTHKLLPPANRWLPQAPLFGRRRFAYLLECANGHGIPERSARMQQQCVVFPSRRFCEVRSSSC